MRLTSKGQVTIPQDIREKLGLLPLTEVEFDVVGDSVRIRKKRGREEPRSDAARSDAQGTQAEARDDDRSS